MRRPWLGLATAVLAAAEFLTACGPAAPVRPPAAASAQRSAAAAAPPAAVARSQSGGTASASVAAPPALDILAPIQPAAQVPAPPPLLGALAFVTAADGWAAAAAGPQAHAAGLILHTTDGGRTWQTQLTSPGPVTSLAFASAAQGWASVGGSVYHTDDGGRRWSAVYPGSLSSLTFPSPTEGWAIGDEPAGRVQGFGPPTVLEHTSDGGRTWGALKEPCGLDELTSVSFPTAADGFVLCTGQPGAGMQGKAVFATTDGGRTWQAAAQVQIGQQTPALGSGGYAHAIVFRDPAHGYLLYGGGAGGGSLAQTADAGRAWTGVRGLPYSEYVDAASFPTAQAGYVALGSSEADALYRTTDGGAAWTEVWPSAGVVPEGGQLVAAAGTAYGVAPAGLVRSTDGGATWAAVGPAPAALSAAAPPHSLFGLDVGSGGTYDLRVSADGGRRWTSTPLPSTVSFPHAVGFASPADGLVDARGGLFRTTDGGGAFVLVDAAAPAFSSLDAVTSTDAWAVGGRSLDHSSDGGARWEVFADPGGAPAQFVSFADAGHGMAIAGAYGGCGVTDCTSLLLSTADGGRTWTARPMPGVEATGLTVTAPGRALVSTPFGLLRTSDGGATWAWVEGPAAQAPANGG